MSLWQSRKYSLVLLGVASALVGTSPAVLSSQAALEEIIVTANKRETSLLETAASISAFDSSAFDLLGIEGSQDLVARTPSLTITTFRVSIRGIGRPNLAVGSEPGVGIYWDGVYNTENGVFNFSRYMDIERIEVLRGPQGTLYGRNSVGGAINFISKRPTEEWSGRVTGELSNYNGKLGQAYASGPVTDKLGMLAGVSKYERDGFQRNLYNGKDHEQDDTLYATLGFNHQTTENWNTNLKVIGVDRGYSHSSGYILEPFDRDLVQMFNFSDTGGSANLPGMFAKQNFVNMRQGLAIENPALEDEKYVKIDRDPQLRNNRLALFLTSDFAADNYSLKYTAGYSQYWFDTSADADASVREDSGVDWSKLELMITPQLSIPVASLGAPELDFLLDNPITPADMTWEVDQEARFSSHELQYSSNWDGDLQLIAGLYYYHSDEEQVVAFREWNDDLMAVYSYLAQFVPIDIGEPIVPVSDENYLYSGAAHVDTRTYATYGQLRWDWTQNTLITAGLRYSYDDKKGLDSTFVQYVRGDNGEETVNREAKKNWDEVTWRIGVDHSLDDTQFLYGFIATGYRSGGFNFQKPTSSLTVDIVKPENILSYEVGYKSSFMDRKGQFSVSAYYYDYEDLQVLKQDVENGIGLNTFVNAKEAVAWGIEMESQLLVGEDFLISGTYSWNDSEYKNFFTKDANACSLGPLSDGIAEAPNCTIDAPDLNLQGNEFPLMPNHKVSVNLTYFWDMFDLDWSATTSYFYTSESWGTPFNNLLYDKNESYDTWDARLGVTTQDKKWQITGFVRNIEGDREVIRRGRPSTVTHNAGSTLLPPRMTGVTVDYTF